MHANVLGWIPRHHAKFSLCFSSLRILKYLTPEETRHLFYVESSHSQPKLRFLCFPSKSSEARSKSCRISRNQFRMNSTNEEDNKNPSDVDSVTLVNGVEPDPESSHTFDKEPKVTFQEPKDFVDAPEHKQHKKHSSFKGKQTKLECICSFLELSVDRFVISPPNDPKGDNQRYTTTKTRARGASIPRVRSWSRKVDREASVPHTTHTTTRKLRIDKLNSGRPRQKLGTLGEIRQAAREECAFCKLLADAVQEYCCTTTDPDGEEVRLKVSDYEVVHVSWEIDGHTRRHHGDQTQNVSRRLLLSWTDRGQPRDAYIVYVPPQNPNLPNSDATTEYHAHDNFFGRPISSNKGKQALIRSWIDKCDPKHSDTCKPHVEYTEAFRDLMNQNYFGVIDVIDMQLKKLPFNDDYEPEKFVALSYVWEHGDTYTTIKSNVSMHLAHGGLESVFNKLPRVIQDTVNLVQRLGLRYLWVDRLCIVQDSIRSWRLNAAAMHLVYGQAYLTICAADGNDAHAGLLAMDPKHTSRQLVATVAPGLQLLVSRPPELVIQGSNWNSRGWTFQERLLSPRCIIFADGKVYFQCRATGMSEDIQTDGNSLGWGLDSTNSPLQSFSQLEKKSILFYMMCISLYSKRNLTFAGDVIAAFDGMSNVMEKTMRAPFCFGLPTSHFDFALLWQPKGDLRRRIEAKGQHDFRGAEFPSWSWTGWQGSFCQYDIKELDGCLLNVNEWLLHHTWIRWYIRDENGNLRPLWDKDVSKADQSTEKRWRGYTGIATGVERYHVSRPRQGIHDRGDPYTAWDDDMFAERDHVRAEFDRLDIERERSRYDVEEGGTRHRYRDRSSQDVEFLRREQDARAREMRLKAEMKRREAMKKAELEALEVRRRRETRRSRSRSRSNSYASDSDRGGGRARREVIRINRVRSPSPVFLPPPPGVHIDRDSEWVDRDTYGRPIRSEIQDKEHDEFKSYISEYPFGNRPPLPQPASATQLTDVPILQFFTWRKPLCIVPREQDAVVKADGLVVSGLQRCDISDSSGDWCGSIALGDKLVKKLSGQECQFIAISEAKAFTSEECPEWTYYVPSQRDESEWDLYFVLLIERDSEKLIWERVGLGKVYKAAFNGASWSEIKLG
jgi:Heterokaryon incompatibility protein (HET)